MQHSIFNLLRLRCGLNQSEVQAYLGCDTGEVLSWISGVEKPSITVMKLLTSLLEKIEAETDNLVVSIYSANPSQSVTIFMFANDAAAIKAGWPCACVYGMAVANAYAALDENLSIRIEYGEIPPQQKHMKSEILSKPRFHKTGKVN